MDANLDLGLLMREAQGAEEEGAEHAKPIPDGMTTTEIIYPILRLTTDAIAPNWKVTDAECTALASAYAGVLDKYFPDGLGAYSVEITAIFVTAVVFAPRMREPRQKPIIEAETAAPAPAHDNPKH